MQIEKVHKSNFSLTFHEKCINLLQIDFLNRSFNTGNYSYTTFECFQRLDYFLNLLVGRKLMFQK